MTDLRVVLADDQQLVRAGFRMILDAEPGFEVVGEAADGLAAVNLVTREEPDVVLMDVRMPHLDGIEATRQISASGVATRVLVVTTFDVDEYVARAVRAGASGFLLKDTPPEELLRAIVSSASGTLARTTLSMWSTPLLSSATAADRCARRSRCFPITLSSCRVPERILR